MDKKAMYQMMGSRPMYAGQTDIINPNNPNVPVEFQTGSYITPQPPSMVPPDPNSVTGLEMQTMPMQQKSIPKGAKGDGLRALPDSTVTKMGYDPATAQMKNNPIYRKSCGYKK
jgi:hypothetical protein